MIPAPRTGQGVLRPFPSIADLAEFCAVLASLWRYLLQCSRSPFLKEILLMRPAPLPISWTFVLGLINPAQGSKLFAALIEESHGNCRKSSV